MAGQASPIRSRKTAASLKHLATGRTSPPQVTIRSRKTAASLKPGPERPEQSFGAYHPQSKDCGLIEAYKQLISDALKIAIRSRKTAASLKRSGPSARHLIIRAIRSRKTAASLKL